ncbi:MAG: DNA repair protein RadA [Methylococcales bacterium]|jgi:DNA repair protein RadA/Sms|nr:DNA repair protein RadA [Methylococcales bacterium]MBT7445821.1 DNA repair protein RadA [Methylococcales bacterium]
MAKTITTFFCTDCGADFPKWQGQCPDCKAWNTISEMKQAKTIKHQKFSGYAGDKSEVKKLGTVGTDERPRFSTNIGELDRVLGQGMVPGSVILIAGSPGAGKSTLLLQLMCHLNKAMNALYVTGEESLQQVALRANRLKLPSDNLSMLAETSVEEIIVHCQNIKPKVVVIDSIQVMNTADVQSAPGGVSQVKESAGRLTQFAKQTDTTVILVGHITKDGTLAGPKVLEHMIDTFLMIEDNNDSRFRTIRGIKNRFGPLNEVGVFAMTDKGMQEVKNPSAIFLSGHDRPSPGSITTVTWEGTRPLLIELQALVDSSQGEGTKRVIVGLDQNRSAMLIAVLNKHGGIPLGGMDIFTNVVGGLKITETSADLALLIAIVSSLKNKSLPKDIIAFGEVGLSGEIRPVPSGQERIREAAKHGFHTAIVPKNNAPKEPIKGIKVIAADKLYDALQAIEYTNE